jgi:hypothetical protein
MRGGFHHAFCTATRAKTAFFAGECYDLFFLARLALKAEETVTKDPALEIGFELFDNVVRHGAIFRLPIGQERSELFLENAVARR